MTPSRSFPRLVFMGSPEFAVPFLEALVRAGYPVAGVVTQPDRPSGRGQGMKSCPVKEWAVRNGLPAVSPDSLRRPEGRGFLEAWSPDLIVVVAYGKILPEEVLVAPRWGCVNVHASLLPKLRGASPIVWAIRNGESLSGLSLMCLDRGMDTGPVLDRIAIPLDPGETTPTLTRKMADVGPPFLLAGLDRYLAGSLLPLPQEGPATLAPILRKEDGLMPFGSSSGTVDAHVRAMNPWPGAFFRSSRGIVRVGTGTVLPVTREALPGQVVAMGREGLDIACSGGVYRALSLQREGGRMMPAGHFLAGCRFGEDEVFLGQDH